MADSGSFDFLRCGTKQFLRRLSGTPSNSARRSQSATCLRPPSLTKSALFAEHLSRLRQDMEEKTASLNDHTFEVTESWLFDFASQHAEYMEKATSTAGVDHEFRSTTDMFRHVLQHPSVQQLIGDKKGFQSLESVAAAKPQPPTPSSTGGVQGSNGNDDVATGACPADSTAATKAIDSCGAAARANIKQKASQFDRLARHAAPLPFPPASDAVRSKLTRSSSCAATCKASASHGQQAKPASGDSELMLKLQQRAKVASWGRLSPRSQRLAEKAGKLSKSEQDDASLAALEGRWKGASWGRLSPRSQRLADKAGDSSSSEQEDTSLAARRKLLEINLAMCGFQKAAIAGGA